MAKWPITGYDGITRTNGPAGFHAFGGQVFEESDEAHVENGVFASYTVSNLRAFLSGFIGGAGADDVIYFFRINNGDGNQTLTINGTGEFEDTSNTDSLVSGDEYCLESDDSAQGHNDSWTCEAFQVTFDAATDVPHQPRAVVGYTADVSALTIAGSINPTTTESEHEYTNRSARQFRDLRAWAKTHTSSSDPVISVRKNLVNTSLAVTITGTGEFVDTSNTADFVAGDEVNFKASDVATGPSITAISTEQDATASICMAGRAIWSFPTITTYFTPSSRAQSTSEAAVEIEAEDDATIQNLYINCLTHIETRTIRSRKNQSNGNLSVSITGTGIFEDLVNSDTLVAEDDMAIVQEAGTTGLNGYAMAFEWETAAAVEAVVSESQISVSVGVDVIRMPDSVVAY